MSQNYVAKILFFGCLLLRLPVLSQDKIYLSTSTKQGNIIGINETVVAYHPTAEKSQTLNIPLRTAELLFNQKGGYLIPGKLNLKEEQAKQAIQSFLNQQQSYWSNDMVFKTDKTVEEGKVTDATDDYITITSAAGSKKIARNTIAIIIYKDGRHLIIGSLANTIGLLAELQGPFAGITATSVASQATPVLQSGSSDKPENGQVNAPAEAPKPLAIDDLINSATKAEFEAKAMDKTRAFTNYLKILCDKTAPPEELIKAVDLALGLFVNDNAIVEASSVNRNTTKRRRIKDYLSEVRQLPYEKIELQWTNVQYVSDLKPAPDGTFRGTVTFEQTFSGFRDGQLVYKDITKKSAEVILKGYTKVVNGQQVLKWDILLGDVGVSWTQKPL